MKLTHKRKECRDTNSAKDTHKKGILRRKFVPIQLTISRKNQCIHAGTKLPFKTSRIQGVLTTSNVEIPREELPAIQRYYTGFSQNKIEDDRFLAASEGTVYSSTYPPDILIENVGLPDDSDDELWWYFAYPATDVFPFFLQSRTIGYLNEYVEINLVTNDQQTPQKYFLISDIFQGNGLITFEQMDV